MVDELWVLDHTGLWENKNIEAGYREFQKGLQKLKSLSEMLAKADMEYGHSAMSVSRLLKLTGGVSGIEDVRVASAFDPHWLKLATIKNTQ